MWFLIDYDRRAGKLATLNQYESGQRSRAEDDRLALEIEHKRQGIEHEVVLIEAESEQALKKTHRRYFESWRAIAASA